MAEFNALKLIEEISNANGASGFEDEVVAVARKYVPAGATVKEDCLRNLYTYRKENTGDKPVVMLDAHSDEVSFMIQAIRPNGLLEFVELGRMSPGNVPAHKVRVRNDEGKYITGVVASKPPHFMTEAEKNAPLDVSQMVIDLGATSYEEVVEQLKIRMAAPAVPDVTFSYDAQRDLMLGKAFDCRLGCASIYGTLNALDGVTDLKVDVVGAMAVQEEVGTRGATVTANTVKPDIAIVFEGCPADDTFSPDYKIQTAIGKGPMLRHLDTRMITNPRYQRWALDLGRELGIPVQESVRSGGSTNGAPIHLSNLGVPCIVIGLPTRYIHTHYGFAKFHDYQAAVRLATEICKRLDREIIAGF